MSKNFELLTEIEKDFCTPEAQRAPEAQGAPERQRVPEEQRAPEAGLAVLPAAPPFPPEAPGAEQELNRLVQRVFFSDARASCRQVVFCGIEAANGSSSVAARSARILAAKANEKVCLIDANAATGSSTASNLTAKPDENPSSLCESCLPVAPGLWLLRWPSGNGDLVAAADLRAVFTALQSEFAYIVVDAPGCLVRDDATVWAQIADAAVLVVEAETSHRVAASRAKQKLEAAGARLAGTVLNNRSYPVPKALYDRL